PVEPGHPLGAYFAGELADDLDLALVAQLQRYQLARPMADAMSNVVACDVQNFAVVGDAPHDDMGVRMARVVVIDRDPVEPSVQVLLDLPYQVAREVAWVGQVGGVFGGDDETELVPVPPASRQEGAAVRLVLQRRVGMTLLAIARDAIP